MYDKICMYCIFTYFFFFLYFYNQLILDSGLSENEPIGYLQ